MKPFPILIAIPALWSVALGSDTKSAESPPWLVQKIWYRVDVPKFVSGNDENGPTGDLQGLKSRLPYIRNLGFNGLVLDSVFPGGGVWDHIDDKVATGGDPSSADSPWSKSDRLFLDFLSTARKEGFHTILALPEDHGPTRDRAPQLRRWLDPDEDKSTNDGVDGFATSADRFAEWKKILDAQNAPLLRFNGKENTKFAKFAPWLRLPAELFAAGPEGQDKGGGHKPLPFDVHTLPRLIQPGEDGATAPTDESLDRWRFAQVCHFALPGAPATQCGDEFAAHIRTGTSIQWPETGKKTDPPHRVDMLALTKLLNQWRSNFKPLRGGGFRFLDHNQEQQTFSYSRRTPGNELIVVANYGKEKRRVTLSIGPTEGQCSILSPQMKPVPLHPILKKSRPPDDEWGIPALNMGGAKQIPDANGNLRFWIKPLTVRLVLIPRAKNNPG